MVVRVAGGRAETQRCRCAVLMAPRCSYDARRVIQTTQRLQCGDAGQSRAVSVCCEAGDAESSLGDEASCDRASLARLSRLLCLQLQLTRPVVADRGSWSVLGRAS